MWRGGILTLNFEIFVFLSIIQCLNLSDENGAFIIKVRVLNCLRIIFTFDWHKQLVFLLNLAVVKQYRQYLKKVQIVTGKQKRKQSV